MSEFSNGIDYAILDDFCRVLKKICCFIWCSKAQILPLLNYFVNQKKCLFEILVWNKTNPTPSVNNTFLPDLEYCLFFREKNVPLNNGYDNKHKCYVSPANKKDKDKFEHPTIKPLEFVIQNLDCVKQKNCIVLDAFMGSGTTAIACKELNLHFIGFELSGKWYKIACDRLNNILADGQQSFVTF